MNNKELIESGMEIMNSFCEALHKADGTLNIVRLKAMSAWELLSLLSTNNVRFIYEGKEEVSE